MEENRAYATMVEEFKNLPPVLTPEQASEALSIGKGYIYELLRTGKIKHKKIGTHYKIPKAYLIEFAICFEENESLWYNKVPRFYYVKIFLKVYVRGILWQYQ